ncbi:MAG: hypothetical protein RLZZ158_1930 [Cyanobacteriota bacterium]|jgi:molybdate transport system substrate-binding protein
MAGSLRHLSLLAAGLAGVGLVLASDFALASSKAAPATPLMVGAAVSLIEPLQALAPSFAKAQKLPTPIFNFASSGVLQKQIQKGAPIDVFVSAAQKQMDALDKAGLLLPGSRRDILSNDLVLVVPLDENLRILSIPGLTADSVRRIAIGDSSVPAGDYARQVLLFYGISDALQGKLVPLGSVRAVANAVAAGDVNAGFIYRSDVQNVANLRIVLAAPPKSHQPIHYSAAVIKSSVQPQQAKAYLSSLTTPQASQLFKRYGLIPFSRVGVTSGTK